MLTPWVNPVTAGKKMAKATQNDRLFAGASQLAASSPGFQAATPPSQSVTRAAASVARTTYWNRVAQSAPFHASAKRPSTATPAITRCASPPARGTQCRHRLREAHAVEPHRDRLREEQHQPDGPAEAQPQGPRDQVVVTAALHPEVGRDRRHRERSQHRDRVGHRDHQQRLLQPRRADHVAQAEEEDDAEDGQDAGREDPGEGAEARAAGRRLVRLGRGGWLLRGVSDRTSRFGAPSYGPAIV